MINSIGHITSTARALRLPSAHLFLLIGLCCLTTTYAYPQPPIQQQQMMFEHSEPVQNHKCREWEWMCEDGVECIAQYDVCDGVAQCADQSDERNCINRFPAESYHRGQILNEQKQPERHQQPPHNDEHQAHAVPSPTPQQKHHDETEAGELNMKYIFGGLSIFVFVAFITHALLKRRKHRLGHGGHCSSLRKGESLIDDEDDLLISQMYNS